MMDKILLDVQNLSVAFPSRHGTVYPVNDVSFTIKHGEIIGFVGESGAGKSMTGAAIINLLDSPGYISHGKIIFNNNDITHYAQTLRGKNIGMIFQDPLTSLNPLLTVGEQLVETIMFHHRDMTYSHAFQQAKLALKEVGIDPNRYDSYPHQFSGGMRQRIVIALALAPKPDLIIADEPTTALDVSVQAQILELLRQLCQQHGTAVILITHDMGVISETTDRMAVLYAGKIVEIGKTEEVLQYPKHPYTKGLIASTPLINDTSVNDQLYQIDGAMPRLDALPNGCAFQPRCPNVMDKCRVETADLINNHVRCWLYE